MNMKFKASSVAGCLITHEHSDHIRSAEALCKMGVECFMSEGTYLKSVKHYRMSIIKKKFKAGTFNITTFDLEHDSAQPIGYLIRSSLTGESLLYATDTASIPTTWDNLNYILVEANWSQSLLDTNITNGLMTSEMKERLIRTHFSLAKVVDFLWATDMSKVKQIHLIHLSHKNANKELFVNTVQEIFGKETYAWGTTVG